MISLLMLNIGSMYDGRHAVCKLLKFIPASPGGPPVMVLALRCNGVKEIEAARIDENMR
jgi:hypothetical protein